MPYFKKNNNNGGSRRDDQGSRGNGGAGIDDLVRVIQRVAKGGFGGRGGDRQNDYKQRRNNRDGNGGDRNSNDRRSKPRRDAKPESDKDDNRKDSGAVKTAMKVLADAKLDAFADVLVRSSIAMSSATSADAKIFTMTGTVDYSRFERTIAALGAQGRSSVSATLAGLGGATSYANIPRNFAPLFLGIFPDAAVDTTHAITMPAARSSVTANSKEALTARNTAVSQWAPGSASTFTIFGYTLNSGGVSAPTMYSLLTPTEIGSPVLLHVVGGMVFGLYEAASTNPDISGVPFAGRSVALMYSVLGISGYDASACNAHINTYLQPVAFNPTSVDGPVAPMAGNNEERLARGERPSKDDAAVAGKKSLENANKRREYLRKTARAASAVWVKSMCNQRAEPRVALSAGAVTLHYSSISGYVGKLMDSLARIYNPSASQGAGIGDLMAVATWLRPVVSFGDGQIWTINKGHGTADIQTAEAMMSFLMTATANQSEGARMISVDGIWIDAETGEEALRDPIEVSRATSKLSKLNKAHKLYQQVATLLEEDDVEAGLESLRARFEELGERVAHSF